MGAHPGETTGRGATHGAHHRRILEGGKKRGVRGPATRSAFWGCRACKAARDEAAKEAREVRRRIGERRDWDDWTLRRREPPCTTLTASAEAEDPALSLDSTHSDASACDVGAPPPRLPPSQSDSLSWHTSRALSPLSFRKSLARRSELIDAHFLLFYPSLRSGEPAGSLPPSPGPPGLAPRPLVDQRTNTGGVRKILPFVEPVCCVRALLNSSFSSLD